MKKILTTAAIAAAAPAAHAQSSVTLYGFLDAGVANISHYAGTLGTSNFHTVTTGSTTTYAANTSAAHPPKGETVFVSSLISTSYFGIAGSEDLGGSLRAIFDLEGKVVPGDGTGANSTPSGGAATVGGLFDRNAYVGLASPVGTVRLGRSYTSAYEYARVGDAIPLGANGSFNLMLKSNGASQDQWNNNQIRYDSPSLAGFTVSGNYAPGGIAGSSSALTSWGGGVKYVGHGLTAAAVYQLDHSAINPAPAANTPAQGKFDWEALAVQYAIGPANLGATYLKTKVSTLPNGVTSTFYWTGYTPSYLYPNGAITSTGAVAAAGNPFRSTDVWGLGGNYTFPVPVTLAAQFYSVKWKNDSIAPALRTGETSRIYTLVAGYAFSKRTSVYLDFVDVRNQDLIIGAANNSNLQGTLPGVNGSALGQRLIGVGLQHKF